jgi:hypothetical protein
MSDGICRWGRGHTCSGGLGEGLPARRHVSIPRRPQGASHPWASSKCLIYFHCEEKFCRTLKPSQFLGSGITGIFIENSALRDVNLETSQSRMTRGLRELAGQREQGGEGTVYPLQPAPHIPSLLSLAHVNHMENRNLLELPAEQVLESPCHWACPWTPI